MLREIDCFDRGGGHELDPGGNEPGDVGIGVHGVFGRGLDLIDEIAVTRADIGDAARRGDEFLEIFRDRFPDPGPAGMRFVARVEIAGIHASEGCALKLAGSNSNFLDCRSRARLILPKLRNASPNRGHTQSPCEEIAPAPGKMVPREFRGLHARTATLRARDFGAQIHFAYLTYRQWENAGRFSRRFRFAPAETGSRHAAVDGPLHLR